MTWIKICGTTNLEDALMSVDAGADALGFVFWEKSPRNIDPREVRKIVEKLPPHVEKVGVFVREKPLDVEQTMREASLTAAQLHYAELEDPGWAVAEFKKYIVLNATDFTSKSMAAPEGIREPVKWQDAFFLDSGNPQQPGGTGKTFDWEKWTLVADIVRGSDNRLVVAGGLTPENVGEAIRILEPWGVDVVSGVEASPGKKDPAKVRAFIQAVRKARK